jgi:hypothetical protein
MPFGFIPDLVFGFTGIPSLGSYSEMCCCSWMAWDFLTLLSHIAFADVAASIYGGGAEEVRGGGL